MNGVMCVNLAYTLPGSPPSGSRSLNSSGSGFGELSPSFLGGPDVRDLLAFFDRLSDLMLFFSQYSLMCAMGEADIVNAAWTDDLRSMCKPAAPVVLKD